MPKILEENNGYTPLGGLTSSYIQFSFNFLPIATESNKEPMVKSTCIMAVCALVLLLGSSGCQNEADSPDASQDGRALTKTEFIAPPDSTISVGQLRKWSSCNQLLDSLTFMYEDSFKVDDAGVRLRYQNDFLKAQDAICVRMGLRGGYDEYVYIRKVMGHPRNRHLLDSVGMAMY